MAMYDFISSIEAVQDSEKVNIDVSLQDNASEVSFEENTLLKVDEDQFTINISIEK